MAYQELARVADQADQGWESTTFTGSRGEDERYGTLTLGGAVIEPLEPAVGQA